MLTLLYTPSGELKILREDRALEWLQEVNQYPGSKNYIFFYADLAPPEDLYE